MTQTIDVEIDAAGVIHPVAPNQALPPGRAKLTYYLPANEEALMSEQALAKDWLRPEEDEAWADLQPEQ